MLIPAWMAYRGRHRFPEAAFRVPGGTAFLVGMILFSLLTVIYSLVC